ncbi:MAG TPA: hypothetical protein VK153_03505 [Candidatus Paceibacterota bacterium]|nr:hypothetical protein [Candidatus Paceibacterota bacterium]
MQGEKSSGVLNKMKKFLPFILIVTILVQVFVPITIGSGVNNFSIHKNTAEAAPTDIVLEVSNVAVSDTTATSDIVTNAPTNSIREDLLPFESLTLIVRIQNADGTNAQPERRINIFNNPTPNLKTGVVIQTVSFTGLTASTPYTIYTAVEGVDEGTTTTLKQTQKSITTNATGETTAISQGSSAVPSSDTDGLPECSIMPGNFHLGGCIAQALYYLFFKTTSFIFGLAGKVLDFAVMYSIQDSSYRSTFVVEGWGLVRDFCNMFFIFVLLYIAFGTILDVISGHKRKEMIINVILIGLLINFSLFATQIIIDASNILTRVFYNQNTIVIKTVENGNSSNVLGEFGEIKLSEAIVSKVDPQKLIIQASEVSKIPQKGIDSDKEETYGNEGISVGSFILVTLLATAVNVVGIVAFMAAGIIFIGRVIGLWLAMILAPIAFFSYTVPALQNMNMVGWRKWWPDTLKMAFLAPIFTFFMYLIVGFMDKGLGIMNADSKTGINFVVAIIVPFIFVMILLLKAKDIAKDMSGTIGQSITNGVASVGGMALGGAALGTAFMGRKLIGGAFTSLSKSESAVHRSTEKLAFNKKLEEWQNNGMQGPKPNWTQHVEENNVKGDLFTRIGAKLNEKQIQVGEVDHARHVVDEAKSKAGFKDVDFNRLSGAQRNKVQEIFVKENKSKWAQDEEDKFRAKNNLSDKDKLDPAQIAELRNNVTLRANEEFEKELHHATEAVSGFTRAFTQVNTGTMDIRNLSDIKSDKREGILTKLPVGLIAGIATGVRSGIKSSGMSNGGIKIQGDFMKDLGNTISDSLKSMKVNVDLSHVGEHKSSADAHGGGGHH